MGHRSGPCAGLSPASQILPSARSLDLTSGHLAPVGRHDSVRTVSLHPVSRVTVVGVGADGWSGLPERLRETVLSAEVLLGGRRHLALVPDVRGQARKAWPSPLRDGLPALLHEHAGRRIVALASGDPLVSGIGATLVDLLGADAVAIEPAVSSEALARARLRWPAETVEVVSLVGREPARVLRALAPGRRVLVLSSDEHTPRVVAGLLRERGYGRSRMTVLGDLGSCSESRVEGTADGWAHTAPPLNIVALELSGPPFGGLLGGLPDTCFEHDGQLTKRDLRVSALARLAPQPGELLWDVGAGAGSVGIEWARAHPTCRTVAVEADGERATRIGRNATALGVPSLQVVHGPAPDSLYGLAAPDAVFVGGGATRCGVIDTCLDALAPGGRLVVHGVTVETEALLAHCHAEHGGELSRLSVQQAEPLGRFTGWTPARTVSQWALVREPA
jgi:precorrin-6B C5,15-methyltransferase / cobalt-precorrin-6B C5,C15-methyltransferase